MTQLQTRNQTVLINNTLQTVPVSGVIATADIKEFPSIHAISLQRYFQDMLNPAGVCALLNIVQLIYVVGHCRQAVICCRHMDMISLEIYCLDRLFTLPGQGQYLS